MIVLPPPPPPPLNKKKFLATPLVLGENIRAQPSSSVFEVAMWEGVIGGDRDLILCMVEKLERDV